MKQSEFSISIRDRIGRHSTLFVIVFVVAFVLALVYIMQYWPISFSGPEIFAITVSLLAILLTGAEFIRAQTLVERQDDIKALNGLSDFRFMMENSDEIVDGYHWDKIKHKSVSEICEAIPGTSGRFRKGLYWITVELRDIGFRVLKVYLVREKTLADGRTVATPATDPRIVRVENILNICRKMIDRIEYVYFGGSIRPKNT